MNPIAIWTYRTRPHPAQLAAMAGYDLRIATYEVEKPVDGIYAPVCAAAWQTLTTRCKCPALIILAAPKWFFYPFASHILNKHRETMVIIPALRNGIWTGEWWRVKQKEWRLINVAWMPMHGCAA